VPNFPNAKCFGMLDLFYPQPGDDSRVPKRICSSCEHKQECLMWAIDNEEEHGIWGGMSPRERRRIRRQIHERQLRGTRHG
jgi:WhiB family redox-sensing transcriptional regulator